MPYHESVAKNDETEAMEEFSNTGIHYAVEKSPEQRCQLLRWFSLYKRGKSTAQWEHST